MSKIDFPYVRLNRVNVLLKKLSTGFINKKRIGNRELANTLEISKSSTANLLATLRALKLVEGRGKFCFTDNGKEYIACLLQNNEESAKKLMVEIVENIGYIKETKTRLSTKGRLENGDIGNQIAMDYRQHWTSPLTVKSIGAAVASVLAFIGAGYYSFGEITTQKPTTKTDTLAPICVRYKKINEIMAPLLSKEKHIGELAKKLKTQESRLGAELSCCIELGLVERSGRGQYRLSAAGQKMLDPDNKAKKRSIFREQLLKSAYKEIIDSVKGEMSRDDIGEHLKYRFGIKGSEWESRNTTNTYAKIFVSWLKDAGILEKIGKKRYKRIDDEVASSQISSEKMRFQDSIRPIGLESDQTRSSRYYLLGRAISDLMKSPNTDFVVKEIVTKIVGICREDEQLRDLVEDWIGDLQLYEDKEIRNVKVFMRDVNRLEKIIGVKY